MLDQFSRQNRWWGDPAAIKGDRHILRMRDAPLAWTPPLPFRFEHDAVYTLRGPRQVGKSTTLKRQIEELLDGGWTARRILYLDVELAGLATAPDLIEALRVYLDAERPGAADVRDRCAVFLDEVTRIENWAGALRGLVDNDELRNVTVVATGSHTRDLRSGGERLPGRRGGVNLDWEILPLSFREYAMLLDPALRLPEPIQALSADQVGASRHARQLLRSRLAALFERYLASGGFLPALNDDAAAGMVRAETFQLYRDAILGEFTRAGMREAYLREVIDWFAGHMGQEFDYRDVAADTDIGSKDTARNYMDNLEASYVATVCYRTHDLLSPSPAFRGPKKLHPVDPLFWHLIRAWAVGDPDPWLGSLASLTDQALTGHLVKSVVAVHARRAFGERVFYWRPDNRREIDFVIAPPSGGVTLLEVKYQQNLGERDIRPLAAFGGGLLASRNQEGEMAGGAVHSLPVAELLTLMNTPSLAPCRP